MFRRMCVHVYVCVHCVGLYLSIGTFYALNIGYGQILDMNPRPERLIE